MARRNNNEWYWDWNWNNLNPFDEDFALWQAVDGILYGAGNALESAGVSVDKTGKFLNDLTGQTESDLFRDALADENATVAHERQKELMALEAEYNSPVYKTNQLAKAGLNPALASGVSNSVGGATAQMSHPNPGQGNLGSVANVMQVLGQMSLLKEEKRGKQLDNDLKEQELYEKTDSYAVRWLGMQAESTLKLSQAQKAMDEAQMLQYEVSWLRKSEDERMLVLKSEKNKNEAIAKYNKMSAEEKQLTNEQLDNWIDKYMDAEQKSELEKKLSEADSIKDANERANFIFWTKAASLVAGGVCMFIPGIRGLGIGLLASTIGWDASAQIGGSMPKFKK